MSKIKNGQLCPQIQKMDFEMLSYQGADKIGAPLHIHEKPYGKGGAEIDVESANRNREKISVKITWYGGDAPAFAKFKNLATKDFHGDLGSVLDYVRNTVFGLAMTLTLGIENPEKVEKKMIKIPLNWPMGASSTERLLEELIEEFKKNCVEVEIDNDQFSIKAEDQYRFRRVVWSFRDRVIETKSASLAEKICKALQSQRIEAKAADNMVLLKEIPFQRNNKLQPEDVYHKARCIALGMMNPFCAVARMMNPFHDEITESDKPEDDSENRVVFEVKDYRFTVEEFKTELEAWGIEADLDDGLLWIKEKDLSVAYEAARLFEQQLHDWDPADWDEEDE